MIPELIDTFERTTAYIEQLVKDIPDAEMIVQPPGAPNHASWTLGHLLYSCQAIAGEIGVTPWLPEDWESCFGYGSAPAREAGSRHSNKSELLSALADATQRVRTALMATDESILAQPLPDQTMRDTFPTIGHALVQVLCAHTAYHAGQVTAWRRAIGRAPVGVFI